MAMTDRRIAPCLCGLDAGRRVARASDRARVGVLGLPPVQRWPRSRSVATS